MPIVSKPDKHYQLFPWRSAAFDSFLRSPSGRPWDAFVAEATSGYVLISSSSLGHPSRTLGHRCSGKD